ncbi:hypothetical protein G7Y79_00003g008940 [Physcia stellaris]|nr:hypothetical protein G7Y79_00003g008940 [Physcia stellaris]
MAAPGSFKPVKDDVSSALIDVTRAVGKIAAEDLAFHRSYNSAVTPLLEKQNRRLLHLVRDLTQASTAGTDVQAPAIPDVDTLEENWHGLVDIFDNLLEKADACLDEYTGVIRKRSPPQEPTGSAPTKKVYPPRSYRSQILPKPQLLFENAPKNQETTPFKPLLRSKPHSIQPLEESIRLGIAGEGHKQYDTQFYLSQGLGGLLKGLVDKNIRYGHPYQAEIEALRYPDFVYHNDIPIPFLPFESTAATFVDTPEAVALMLEELKSAKEIAVDLEHHDTHSYLGLTSLMQISTRHKDWVVDTLRPWREDLQILNEVFADPSILKVDTSILMRFAVLLIARLAALLARHANFNAAKQYQMADWRIRPLPEEMFNYARSDTHFLLYVYDILRNELLEKSEPSKPEGDLIDTVLRKSKEEALQRYERPFYDAQRGTGSNGWYNILSYTPALLSRQQFAVFRAVHHWRDIIARQEDESLHTIMPKHVIYNIAREMPMEMAALLGCSQPISTFVRFRAGELLGVIKQAKIEGTTGPDMMEIFRTADPSNSDLVEVTVPVIEADVAMVPRDTSFLGFRNGTPTSSKLAQSSFWGATLSSILGGNGADSGLAGADGICLALPLPQLTAEVFADPDTMKSANTHYPNPDQGARAEHAYVKERKAKEEEIFIVKHVGGLKKRKAAELEDPVGPPEPVLLQERKAPTMDGTVEDDLGHGISSMA